MIGISLLTLNLAAGGGTVTFTRGLLDALARVGELEARVFVPRGRRAEAMGLPAVELDVGGESRPQALARLLVMPGRVRRALRASSALHFPVGVMLPTIDDRPAVTTIHDLQHEALPQFFSRAQLAYRRFVYGRTVQASRILVADSEHARAALLERYGLDPERVRTIHLGVDLERFTPDGRAREQFLLYPANRWPHKNHERLFEAFALVRRERPDLRLVLTGGGHDGPLPAGVEALGHVSLDRLVELYRSAAALVFPSLYEGFGIPPLEAMACGCPVAVSRTGPLSEVCGEAAVYFDPASTDDVARGIVTVLDAPTPGGVERAGLFGWEACARKYEAVYRELAELRS